MANSRGISLLVNKETQSDDDDLQCLKHVNEKKDFQHLNKNDVKVVSTEDVHICAREQDRTQLRSMKYAEKNDPQNKTNTSNKNQRLKRRHSSSITSQAGKISENINTAEVSEHVNKRLCSDKESSIEADTVKEDAIKESYDSDETQTIYKLDTDSELNELPVSSLKSLSKNTDKVPFSFQLDNTGETGGSNDELEAAISLTKLCSSSKKNKLKVVDTEGITAKEGKTEENRNKCHLCGLVLHNASNLLGIKINILQ